MTTLQDRIAGRLANVRSRTLTLVGALDEASLRAAPDPIMSPPLWDLGHIAAFEELWLTQRVAGRPSRYPELQATYDAFETPRAQRASVEILGPTASRDYLEAVRAESLDLLRTADLAESNDPLIRDGVVFELVAEHEAQHAETILQTLQLRPAGGYVPPSRMSRHPVGIQGPTQITIPGGTFSMGAGKGEFAYDCERPRHARDVASFRIARTLVSNGDHLAFMADGGYRRPELWSPAGAAWLQQAGAEAPLYWERDGEGSWAVRSFNRIRAVEPDGVLCHVSWFEADAHARWAGGRLPTEVEWERAATFGAVADGCAYPWGVDMSAERANLGAMSFETAPSGAYPAGASPSGCLQMIGDVWEWTSTPFEGYPGFRAFPYPEYAEVFFGRGYPVLRGGSWATQTVAARTTFRNWDLPERRQIFAGLRVAWDEPEDI